jgi:pyruvate kinase
MAWHCLPSAADADYGVGDMSRTRIVATLGPATSSAPQIRALIDAGVDVFRLNFSHGTHAGHGRMIETIRHVAGSLPIAILQDLGGPKLRLDRRVQARPGDVIELALPPTVRPGDSVLLADGLMQLEVVDAQRCRVIIGGDVSAGKGMNLPSSRLDVPSFTDKDREDLRFGLGKGVDFVAVSFVRRASDLEEAKASGAPVIAKVETAEAVERMEEIVHAADAVMVARGDLGVEIPIERVPIVQKALIALANRKGKPVITATQMLGSMVGSLLPTRAEATDVANAALDGTDAVMLSEETAVGAHPVDAVRMMGRILGAAAPLLTSRAGELSRDPAELIARAACEMAERLGASAIVVPTRSGFTARKVAAHRPPVPILALTPEESVRRRLQLVWGVAAVTVPWLAASDTPAALERFREPVRAMGLVREGACVVVTAGWPVSQPGTTNLLHVTTL